MTNDDFNFMRDDSDLPLSIEELAAYLDGNLSDAEMQHVASVIESSDPMQSIMDGLEQAEDTFAGYGAEDVQLPEELAEWNFEVPEMDLISDVEVNEDNFYAYGSFDGRCMEDDYEVRDLYSDVDHQEISNDIEMYDSDLDDSIS